MSGNQRDTTAMKPIDRRLNKLEHRLGIVSDAPRYLVILMDAGQELGAAEEAYIKSLEEAGLFTGVSE
jgi:hypothetical protein